MLTMDARGKSADQLTVMVIEAGSEIVGGFMIIEHQDPQEIWMDLACSEGSLPDPWPLFEAGRVYQFFRLVIDHSRRGNPRAFEPSRQFLRLFGEANSPCTIMIHATLSWRTEPLYIDYYKMKPWSPPYRKTSLPHGRTSGAPSDNIILAQAFGEGPKAALEHYPISADELRRSAEIAQKYAAENRNKDARSTLSNA